MPSDKTPGHPSVAKPDSVAGNGVGHGEVVVQGSAACDGPQPTAQPSQGGGVGTARFAASGTPHAAERWGRIPASLRERKQWALAGNDKRPLTVDGDPASSTDPNTWADFDSVCRAAEVKGLHIGYMIQESDPFTCIDMDVKDSTPQEHIERFQAIVSAFDSYTERSRSGRGLHVWVEGKIGKGRKRDGVELYSQERFMICTGDTYIDKPISNRQELLDTMASGMRPSARAEIQLTGDDSPDWELAARAAEDPGELGRLFAGDYEGRYPSQSEADLALVKLLMPHTDSPRECWATFRLSELGKRDKASRSDYAKRTLSTAAEHLANDAAQVEHGRQIAENLFLTGSGVQQNPRTTPEAAQCENSAPQDGFKFKFAKPGETIPQIKYLIDPWLPCATVIGCYGRGEAGKSSWAAQICAEASGSVSTLWISSEERQDHILQRHLACGGEASTLAVIEALPKRTDPVTQKAVTTNFNLYEHMEPALLEFQQDAETRKDRPLGIVILDAVVALVTWGKGENANDDASVKRLIGFLFTLAEQYGVSFVILGHLNKSTFHNNIADAVTGSAAWTNSVRLAYMFVKDMESENYEGFIRTVKSNTGAHFGANYRTVPVYTLRQRPDGKDDVLCGAVMIGSIVWGEVALREMMADEDDPWLDRREKKLQKVQSIVEGALHVLQSGPTTRKAVEDFLGEKVTRRHWQEADKILANQHGVQMRNEAHNLRVYYLPAAS